MGPWYHLSAQEIQPLFGEHRLGGDGRGWVRTHCCLEDAWHGGSSLVVRGVIPPEVGNVAVRWVSDGGWWVHQLLPSHMVAVELDRWGSGGQNEDRGQTQIGFLKLWSKMH